MTDNKNRDIPNVVQNVYPDEQENLETREEQEVDVKVSE